MFTSVNLLGRVADLLAYTRVKVDRARAKQRQRSLVCDIVCIKSISPRILRASLSPLITRH